MALSLGINEVKILSEALSEKLGFNYGNYNFSFLKRRFNLVFDELNVKKIDQFLELLTDSDYKERFLYFFAVPVSELFRDPSFWRVVRFKVPLSEECDNIIWFPDASSGEEIFSMLILLSDCDLIDKISIHCNHPSKRKLDEIKEGILREKNLEVNESNLKRFGAKGALLDYFEITAEGLKLNKELLKNLHVHHCHFSDQKFKQKPYITIFRNSMLYFNRKYWVDSCFSIYNNMCTKGFLAIGIKESLPDSILNNMLPYDNNEQIYKRHPASVSSL